MHAAALVNASFKLLCSKQYCSRGGIPREMNYVTANGNSIAISMNDGDVIFLICLLLILTL